jgi:hypothetical protein
MQKTSLTDIGSIASETFNIPREELDKLVSDLEAKGKIKRLDENFVKLS